MTITELTRASEASSRRGYLQVIHSYLGGRRGLIAAGAVIVVAGLAFNWSWLVAAGFAPVLLSLLPCAAMCALGLCMNRMVGASSNQRPTTRPKGRARSTLVFRRTRRRPRNQQHPFRKGEPVPAAAKALDEGKASMRMLVLPLASALVATRMYEIR